MTIRTWRQGDTLMATAADAPLDAATLAVVSEQAHRRWPWIREQPGILLASELDEETRAVARERPDIAADVRQVDGLPSGWAIAWIDPDALASR